MQWVVRVTRRGQTTIPLEFRKKYGIDKGDKLVAEDTQEGLLFRVIPRLDRLAGVDADFGKVEEVKKEIERLREEY